MNDQQDYNYNTAGLDGFLSRSIDNLAQMTLDSQGPVSTQTRFDVGQISGGIGDSFKVGGISLAGKTNELTLNDGLLTVNDTTTSASVQASSGNLSYRDTNGNLVVQEGILDHGATGIRIVDKNGIGLAQFSRNADGTTSLKIAQPGIEVSTANNNQLIFNSSQDVLKVTLTGTSTINGQVINAGQTLTNIIPHNLGQVPASLVYVNAPSIIGLQGGLGITSLPLIYAINGTVGLSLQSRVDATNLYLDVINVGATNIDYSAYSWTFKYYILQETAS